MSFKRISKFTFLLFSFFLLVQVGHSQEKDDIIRPLLLDKMVLSGIGLDTVKLKNEPNRDFFQKRLYGGREISVYVVSSQTWKSEFEGFWFDEFICIIDGQAKVIHNQDSSFFSAKEFIFAPKGFKGSWEVQAGDTHHFELSVITNRRSPKSSKDQKPFVLDIEKISSLNKRFQKVGRVEEILAKGEELEIKLISEFPSSSMTKAPITEQMINVLSGIIQLTDTDGREHIFYTGEYFVIPKEYQGTWSSNGHGMVKYLSIQKST